jgi:oligopeptide/dipeptide ABC transporter ATP-binding protein
MSEILLDVKNLKMHFPVKGGLFQRQVDTIYAVDDISFYIKAGETLGLVGESGCGKSTLGRAVLRLYKPTAGEILFEGKDIAKLEGVPLRAKRRDMQMVFQDPYASLNPRQTVGKILQDPLEVHGIGTPQERREEVERLLVRVGLPASAAGKYPHEFSGGQRQRVGIARAISLKPKLIICDEAVSALDVSIQSQVLNLLMELQQELRLTYLFISHDLAVVRHISDRVAVMYLGKIVELTDADTIYSTPAHPYTRALLSSIPEPDPETRFKKRQILSGDVPSPMRPPSGCRFHTRCPYVQDVCRTVEPPLADFPGTKLGAHLVACHFAGKLDQN